MDDPTVSTLHALLHLNDNLDEAIARAQAIFLRSLDAAEFADLLGALQAEATVRGWHAAIPHLGAAQAAVEHVARDAMGKATP